MNLYFTRHGETQFNRSHRIQGVQFDDPLNKIGIKQMDEAMLPDNIEVIYSSSLKRAYASAEIISRRLNKPIIVNEELTERDFGSLAGKTWDELPNGRMLQEIDRRQEYDYRKFGGESVVDVKNRLNNFLELIKHAKYENILAVSSIGLIRLAYMMLANKSVVDIPNGSVHLFTFAR